MQIDGRASPNTRNSKAAIMENAARNPRPNMLADERVTYIFWVGERQLRTGAAAKVADNWQR
jgi:hypothetical protein